MISTIRAANESAWPDASFSDRTSKEWFFDQTYGGEWRASNLRLRSQIHVILSRHPTNYVYPLPVSFITNDTHFPFFVGFLFAVCLITWYHQPHTKLPDNVCYNIRFFGSRVCKYGIRWSIRVSFMSSIDSVDIPFCDINMCMILIILGAHTDRCNSDPVLFPNIFIILVS